MEVPGKLVVRTYAPARRWVVAAIVVLLGSLALYVAFELGRFKAGYDAMQAAAERDALQRHIDQLEQAAREMRVKLAADEEARVADVRERDEVARTIGELQAQVERQQQDIEFYRGMVAQPGQKDPVVLSVQQFHVAALPVSQTYSLRFSLNRLLRPGEPLNGVIGITLGGTQEGNDVTEDLSALASGKKEIAVQCALHQCGGTGGHAAGQLQAGAGDNRTQTQRHGPLPADLRLECRPGLTCSWRDRDVQASG